MTRDWTTVGSMAVESEDGRRIDGGQYAYLYGVSGKSLSISTEYGFDDEDAKTGFFVEFVFTPRMTWSDGTEVTTQELAEVKRDILTAIPLLETRPVIIERR